MLRNLYIGLFLLSSANVMAQPFEEAAQSWKGIWKTTLNGKTVYERWSGSKDGFLSGDSWKVDANGDSAYFEKLRLFMQNDTLCYEPNIPGEHSGGIVFQLVQYKTGQWLFYHPTNEFPRFIRYTLKDQDHLEAVIYNEENEMVKFNYERIKP